MPQVLTEPHGAARAIGSGAGRVPNKESMLMMVVSKLDFTKQ